MNKSDIRKLFLIVIFSYMVLEVAYRITVLNLSVDTNMSESTMQVMEWFGCFLAGVGVTLVLNRIRILNIFVSLVIFLGVLFGMRWFVDHCVDYISKDRQEQAVLLSKQKLLGLNQKAEMPLLSGNVYQGHMIEKIVLANASSVAFAQNVSDTKKLLMQAVAEVELDTSVVQSISKMYEDENAQFMRICKCQSQVDSYNRLYGDARWNHPIGQKYGRALVRKEFVYKSFRLNAFDVPLGISRSRFEYWLNESFKHELQQFAKSDVSKRNTESFARWIWFTPISLGLSLFSLIFNFASFVTLLIQGPLEARIQGKYASLMLSGIGLIIWLGIVGSIYAVSISSTIPDIAHEQIQALSSNGIIGRIWSIAQIIDIRIFG